MKLYLMRHAEPTPGHPMDATRQLTDAGKKQAAQMAAFLVRDIGRVDIVISSPFARTMETAEIMADALGSYVAATTLLEPEAEPEKTWAEIARLAQQAEDVLVVGHHPNISLLLAWLIHGGVIRFDHGAIGHVQCLTMDQGTHDQIVAELHWFVGPRLVEKEAGGDEVIEAAKALADSLTPKPRRRLRESSKPTQKKIQVAAFALVLPDGSLGNPEAVEEDDDLYVQRPSDPGAGIVSKASTGMLFASALAALEAGKEEIIPVAIAKKTWILGDGGESGNCQDCIDNADDGPIDADDDFTSGVSEPEAHPNCTCSMDIST